MPTIDMSIAYMIENAANRIDTYRNKRFSSIDLTSAQARILKEVASARGGLSLSEIASRMPVETLPSRLVSVMVERGLMEREAVPKNRRMQSIRLTRKGKALVPKVRRIDRAINRWIATQLAPYDVNSVKDALSGFMT